MIEIFYKSKGQVLPSNEMALLNDLGWDDVLWIDLFEPTGEEKRSVEEFLETTLQSRAQAEEIESSSRYSETETTIFANTNRDWLKIEVLEEEAAVAFIASKNQTDTMGREATVTLSYATLPSIDIRVSQTFWVAPVYISDKIVYNNKVVLTVATNDKNYTWSCGLIPKSTFGEGWSDEDI